ncbi:MAG: hypothetical protein ACK5IJ_06985 [Mangrovibacterium sp.]
MKRVLLGLSLFFVLSLIATPRVFAGVVSSAKEVISSVNDFDGSKYGLSDKESEEVKGLNSKLIEGAFGIIDGDDSWFSKRKQLKHLKKEAKQKYSKILKGKGPVKQFKKDMKKKMKPFTRKMRLLKLVF